MWLGSGIGTGCLAGLGLVVAWGQPWVGEEEQTPGRSRAQSEASTRLLLGSRQTLPGGSWVPQEGMGPLGPGLPLLCSILLSLSTSAARTPRVDDTCSMQLWLRHELKLPRLCTNSWGPVGARDPRTRQTRPRLPLCLDSWEELGLQGARKGAWVQLAGRAGVCHVIGSWLPGLCRSLSSALSGLDPQRPHCGRTCEVVERGGLFISCQWGDSVSHKELKVLGQHWLVSTGWHLTARSRPGDPRLCPLPRPAPSVFCRGALLPGGWPSSLSPLSPSSLVHGGAGPQGCWVGSWQQGPEGDWVWPPRAEQRAPAGLMDGGDSVFPSPPQPQPCMWWLRLSNRK